MLFRGKKSNKGNHTRVVNPKAGFLGFTGFLGFVGFIPYFFTDIQFHDFQQFPIFLFFFGFFGFFGFYYEGKMSNTLIDERFEFNAKRSSAIANKIALWLIFGVAILSPTIANLANIFNAYNMLSVLSATIGIAIGLASFLEQYLLYRFENEGKICTDFNAISRNTDN